MNTLEQRRNADKELERKLDRAMLPILLPMAIAAGAVLGLLVAIIILPPLPRSFVSLFLLVAMVVAFAPTGLIAFKYRKAQP